MPGAADSSESAPGLICTLVDRLCRNNDNSLPVLALGDVGRQRWLWNWQASASFLYCVCLQSGKRCPFTGEAVEGEWMGMGLVATRE